MVKIRLKLEGAGHSTGRGVGFYHHFLEEALVKTGQIELVTHEPDILHYTFFDPFYPTLPFKKAVPTVVTIHDLTPLVLTALYPKGIRGLLNLYLQTYSLKSAKAVITDSVNSQNDIHRLLGIDINKIHPIPLAVDPLYHKPVSAKEIQRVKEKFNLPERFVLYVGGINANKNLLRLAQACTTLKVPLIFVGKEFLTILPPGSIHPELIEFAKLTRFIAVHPEINTLGFVETPDLTAIYRLATVYCLPSLYEGFGLPLLEAMSTGCLVASSNKSCLPEIYPTGTLSFNPEDVNEMTNVLDVALHLKPSERSKLVSAGQKRAADFSWAKTAEKTLAVYRQLV